MRRWESGAARVRAALLAVGIVLLAVVAVPERRPDDGARRLPRLDAAPRLSGFLSRAVAAGDGAFPAGGVELGRLLALDPRAGADLLEARIAALRFGGDPLLPRLDAALGLLWPRRSLPPVDPPATEAVLPLRAPAELSESGLSMLRVAAENVAALPSDVVLALASLVAVAEAGDALPGFDREGAAALLRDAAAAVDRGVPVLRRAAARGVFARLSPLPDGEGVPRGLLLLVDSAAGFVVVGSGAATVLPMEGVAVAVDVGGDDLWLGGVAIGPDSEAERPEPRVRIVIDLAGRDRYVDDGRTFASTQDGGVSLLVDEEGDDRYEATDVGLAAAPEGAVLLLDRAGRDRYRAPLGGLGFAGNGFALLLDDGGDDRFEVSGPGLGAASGGGAAVVLDAWGNDVHLALGALPDPGEAPVLALGAATGGGLGLFADRDGVDVYRAASRAGGYASAGVAVFLDAGGDDLLSFGDDALGCAAAGGFALFRDLAGDDQVLSRARSLAFADAGIALHLDDAGEDERLSRRPSVGAAEHGGTGIFVDLDGR